MIIDLTNLPTPDYVSPDGDVVLYCADCLEVLPQLPEGIVDAVVTDPPYGVDLGKHAGAKETRKGLLVKSGGYEDSKEYFWDNVAPAVAKSISIAQRAMVFGVPPSMWMLPEPDAIGGVFIPGAVGRNRWGWSTLIHCLLYGIAPDLHRGAKPTAIRSTAVAEKTGHPTTKPLEWIVWAVSLGSREEEIILDPFLGSGTTAVACIKTGRKCIGIEKERKYFDIAVTRIEKAYADQALFAEAQPA